MHVWFEITIKDAGTAIKKPWRIVSWGVSFFDLHEKCDGSHPHVHVQVERLVQHSYTRTRL